MSDFSIGTRTGDGCVVLMLAGDLDVRSAPTLRAALVDAFASGAAAVTVDLDLLRFCDSMGLSTLIFGYQRAGLRSTTFAVINARGGVAAVLEAAGLKDVLSPDGSTATRRPKRT